jgi:anti-anti-sigma factor
MAPEPVLHAGDAASRPQLCRQLPALGQLWRYLSYLVGQGHHHIVLDLRGMVLIDSAGVEVLARVSAWTRRKGGDLELRSVSPVLAEQLELASRAEARRHHPSASTD